MAASRLHNFIFGENNGNHTNPYFNNQSYNSLNTTSPQQCILVEKHYIPLELYQTTYPSQHNNTIQQPIYANSNHFSYFTDPIINTNQTQQPPRHHQPQNPQQPQQPFSNIIDLLFTIPLNTNTTNDENQDNIITIDILSKNSIVSIYDEDANDSTCSVCLDIIRNSTIVRKLTSCNHIFHLECIDRWVATNHKCPLCRTNINPDATTHV